MPWTEFNDMHSGGSTKEPYEYIYIEAAQADAINIFYNRFGHDPCETACDCCGENYSISEDETLEEACLYQRRETRQVSGITRESIADFSQRKEVLIIYEHEIKPEERRSTHDWRNFSRDDETW